MPTFSAGDLEKLDTCDLRLQLLAKDVVVYIPHKILEGHRGEIAQHQAFLDGKSQLDWPNGKHNKLPSTAMDVAPLYFDAGVHIDWNDRGAFGRLMGHYERAAYQRGIKIRLGMDWDMDWRTSGLDPNSKFLDMPHIEIIDIIQK